MKAFHVFMALWLHHQVFFHLNDSKGSSLDGTCALTAGERVPLRLEPLGLDSLDGKGLLV